MCTLFLSHILRHKLKLYWVHDLCSLASLQCAVYSDCSTYYQHVIGNVLSLLALRWASHKRGHCDGTRPPAADSWTLTVDSKAGSPLPGTFLPGGGAVRYLLSQHMTHTYTHVIWIPEITQGWKADSNIFIEFERYLAKKCRWENNCFVNPYCPNGKPKTTFDFVVYGFSVRLEWYRHR